LIVSFKSKGGYKPVQLGGAATATARK